MPESALSLTRIALSLARRHKMRQEDDRDNDLCLTAHLKPTFAHDIDRDERQARVPYRTHMPSNQRDPTQAPLPGSVVGLGPVWHRPFNTARPTVRPADLSVHGTVLAYGTPPPL